MRTKTVIPEPSTNGKHDVEQPCAEAVVRLILGLRILKKTRDSLPSVWSKLAEFVETRTAGFEPNALYKQVQNQYLPGIEKRNAESKATAARLRAALAVAWKHAVDEELEDEPEPTVDPVKFRLGVMGAEEFERTEFVMQWLVRRVLVANQPAVLAAPKKGMKTSFMVDFAVSLASGTPFLGHFDIPEAMPVMLLSGESGGFVIKDTVRRVCRAKGIEIRSMEGRFFVGFQLPQLSIPEQLAELARVIRENGIKVVIIDPLYLCLIGAASIGRRIEPSNLFDMGPLLLQISQTCLEAGATPILVHHFKKTGVDPNELPELDSMAFAGIQEFARQWILISRRKRFEPGSGKHELWFTVGGSAGHSGEWAIDIDEGVMNDDFQGRTWDVTVRLASEAREEVKEDDQAVKIERHTERAKTLDLAKETRLQNDAVTALAKLQKIGAVTESAWRKSLNWNSDRIGSVAIHLNGQGKIREARIKIPSGKSGSREVTGWEVMPESLFPASVPEDPNAPY